MIRGQVVFIPLLLGLAGCGSSCRILVVRGAPIESASVTVIPSAVTEGDVDLAARVERALSRAGLRVLERPPYKYVAAKQTAEGYAVGNLGAMSAKSESVIDLVAMYPEVKADFVVATYMPSGLPKRIRIIKHRDGAVVVNHQLNDLSAMDDEIYSALLVGGFLKETHEERQCMVRTREGAYYRLK